MCVGLGLSWEPPGPSLPQGMEFWSRAAGRQLLGSLGEILGKGLSPDLPSPGLPLLQALDPFGPDPSYCNGRRLINEELSHGHIPAVWDVARGCSLMQGCLC